MPSQSLSTARLAQFSIAFGLTLASPSLQSASLVVLPQAVIAPAPKPSRSPSL